MERSHVDEKQERTEISPSKEPTSAASESADDGRTKEQLIEDALNCPCIESLKRGSCGEAFIAAYRCFLESESEPRGSDCYDTFQRMQDCMLAHPEEYHFDGTDTEEEPEPEPESLPNHAQRPEATSTGSGTAPRPTGSLAQGPSTNAPREPPRSRAIVAAASSNEDEGQESQDMSRAK